MVISTIFWYLWFLIIDLGLVFLHLFWHFLNTLKKYSLRNLELQPKKKKWNHFSRWIFYLNQSWPSFLALQISQNTISAPPRFQHQILDQSLQSHWKYSIFLHQTTCARRNICLLKFYTNTSSADKATLFHCLCKGASPHSTAFRIVLFSSLGFRFACFCIKNKIKNEKYTKFYLPNSFEIFFQNSKPSKFLFILQRALLFFFISYLRWILLYGLPWSTELCPVTTLLRAYCYTLSSTSHNLIKLVLLHLWPFSQWKVKKWKKKNSVQPADY